VDAGVLIAAARGTMDVSAAAMAILDDPDRSFASSAFVRLEVLPKAVYHRRSEEAEFYLEFFRAVTHWPANTDSVVRHSHDIGMKLGARCAACCRSRQRRSRGVHHDREAWKATPSHDRYPRNFDPT